MADFALWTLVMIGAVIAAALVYLCLQSRERTRLLRAAAAAPAPLAEPRRAPAEANKPNNVKQQIDAAIAEDRRLSGYWEKPGEMFEGFPIGADDVVVDVGCGNGKLLAECAQRAAQVIATDLSAESVGRVLERLQETDAKYTAFVSDATHLPLADETASRVIMSEVLEHVDDPDAVMAELVRVGRKGALYYLSVPDPASENLMKQIAPASAFQKPHHIRIIGREDFAAMVERGAWWWKAALIAGSCPRCGGCSSGSMNGRRPMR